jgi:hypothetical protein
MYFNVTFQLSEVKLKDLSACWHQNISHGCLVVTVLERNLQLLSVVIVTEFCRLE